MLEKTKAPRFRVAARLASVFGREPLDETGLPRMRDEVRQILDSKHASHFVKGLAALQGLRLSLWEDPQKGRQAAEEIVRTYEGGVIVDEADGMLQRAKRRK